MKKRVVIIPTLFLVILILVVFAFIYIVNRGGTAREKELTPEFLDWLNKSERAYDFNNPYVECLFTKTCDGIFHLEIETKALTNLSQLEEIINKYGKIGGSYQNYNLIYFETRDIDNVDNFIDNPLIANITLASINPDKINIPDRNLYSCNTNDDCVKVNVGCCGCSDTVINKNYTNNLASFYSISCTRVACAAVVCSSPLGRAIKCIDKKCTFVNWTEAPCDSELYPFCKNYIQKSLWDTFEEPCTRVVNLCEKGISKEVVIQKCIDNVNQSTTNIPGYVIAYFDQNSTEEEISNFIDKSSLSIEKRLTDYYYQIQGVELTENGSTSDFVNYLKSFTNKTKSIPYSGGFTVVYFYGTVSLNESESILRGYRYLKNLISPEVFSAERIGVIKVPEGQEADFICRLKEEPILYRVGFIPPSFFYEK